MMVVWGVALLLLGLLERVGGATEGCARWVPSADDGDVCCQQCHQGNQLVRKCGPDPQTLCAPCREGTYLSDPGLESCRRCTQCTGVRTVTQACTSASDTVCCCRTGYRCADAKCSSCSQECGEGQQPVANGTCQACPPGTFNHKIHSQCVPWSTRCPQPEQKMVKPGTAVSDIVCDFLPNGGNGRTEGMMVALLVMAPVFLAILAVCILIIWNKKKKMMMKKQQKQTTTKEPATDTPVTASQHLSRGVSDCHNNLRLQARLLYSRVEGFKDRRDARKYASSLLKHGYLRHTVNKITFSEQCYYTFGDLCQNMASLNLNEGSSGGGSEQDTLAPLPHPPPSPGPWGASRSPTRGTLAHPPASPPATRTLATASTAEVRGANRVRAAEAAAQTPVPGKADAPRRERRTASRRAANQSRPPGEGGGARGRPAR